MEAMRPPMERPAATRARPSNSGRAFTHSQTSHQLSTSTFSLSGSDRPASV